VHHLIHVFLPVLTRVGVKAEVALRRWGWYPAGGGEIEATIAPAAGLGGFVPGEADPPGRVMGLSAVSRLPRSIAERQQQRAEERLGAAGIPVALVVEEDRTARSPGTFLFLAEPGRAGASALGRRGVPAERVADEAVDAFLAVRAAGTGVVDPHLADQLVPFLAVAGAESRYRCPVVSGHLRTVAWVVEQFLPVEVVLQEGPPAQVRIMPARR
jgi:RNA 3'-terminal phosphate cyclase (ATP)